MDEAIEQLQAKDIKERMAGVERLQTLLEQSRKGLSSNEVGNLVDASLVLLKDNNFRVTQGTLQALASAAALAGEHLKLHFNALLPAIVERLGDGKQPVRDAGRRLLLALMEVPGWFEGNVSINYRKILEIDGSPGYKSELGTQRALRVILYKLQGYSSLDPITP